MSKKAAKAKEVRRVRIGEAAEALAFLLEKHGADKKGRTVKKAWVLQHMEAHIWELRRDKGYLEVPTVLNTEVKVADERYCRNNWKAIRETAAEMEYFVIWNPKGEPVGIRLGSLEEYQEQQALVMNLTEGFKKFHNQRADIIRGHGQNAGKLDLSLRKKKRRGK
jgi:hypothetical protein